MDAQVEISEQKLLREAAARFNRAIDEAQALQTTERILAGVERAMFKDVAEPYDTRVALEATRALNHLIRDEDLEQVGEAAENLKRELAGWRASIVARDQEIMTYSLRRFCEKADEALDAHVFAVLLRFYRSLPRTELVQSKYDFVVTRLFARETDEGRRVLQFSREQLASHLAEMCAAWDETSAAASCDETEVARAVARFDHLIEEVSGVEEFEELIAGGLFNRIRAFKSRLGELFSVPEITAAAIECNVLMGNKFSVLLAEESEQISDAKAALLEFAEIFREAPSSAAQRVESMLNRMQEPESEVDVAASERLTRLLRLLRIACVQDELDELLRSFQTPAGEDSKDDANPDDPQTLPVLLRELAEKTENKEIIRDYLKGTWSNEVRALDLAAFLAPMPETDAVEGVNAQLVEDEEQWDLSATQLASVAEEQDANLEEERASIAELSARVEEQSACLDALRRDSLALILRADEMLRRDLSGKGALNSETEANLTALLAEMQKLGEGLRDAMSVTREREQRANADVLLHISNHLLSARLRLQSAIVRRSASELARQEAARAKTVKGQKEEKPKSLNFVAVYQSSRRWIIAAAVLLLVVTIALRFSASYGHDTGVERDKNVRIINPHELPGGECLSDARIRREVLIGTVSDIWSQLDDAMKRERLRAFLQAGKDKGITSVMLLDRQGAPAGTATGDQISLQSELQPQEQ